MTMNVRELNKHESANLQKLSEAGLECGLIYLTLTGLTKGYFDATAPIRDLFKNHGVHNYDLQGQGQKDHGIYITSTIYVDGEALPIPVSIYRPKTKKGDPRMWPQRLKRYANPEDVLAIFCLNRQIHLLNLTTQTTRDINDSNTDLSRLISEQELTYNRSSDELLHRLRDLANTGPIRSDGHGDTSIGRTVETALGIPMNSSKEPDFNGIELKAKRRQSNTRQSLFSKVPDWNLSAFKSIREIINRFGYDVDGLRKLNCSVYATKVNSQGLFLDLHEEIEQLHEMFQAGNKKTPVCLWTLPTLHQSLLLKHRETFWITAEELTIHGKIHFQLQRIKHTRRPSTIQFNRLLASGEISIDHMIKQTGDKVHERGPQFKIKSAALEELFLGRSKEYNLTS